MSSIKRLIESHSHGHPHLQAEGVLDTPEKIREFQRNMRTKMEQEKKRRRPSMRRVNMAQKIEEELRPEGGWWSQDSSKVITTDLTFLMSKGLTAGEAQRIVESILGVGRSEYGE